ncbi:ABC-type bacteriocin/lantibiotic exporters, contain an N-terminal double-glycine peptidase domain [Enterococcus casseliflavus]|nr:ABC-type bacteriocin/lantibiotic exporters, contain an N-terminal double-glycine peptidase domain [Enterococcus casseliflavus]
MIVYIFRKKKKLVYFSLIFVFLSTLLGLPIPYFTKMLLDDVLFQQNFQILNTLIFVIILIGIFESLSILFKLLINTKFVKEVSVELKGSILKSFYHTLNNKKADNTEIILSNDIDLFSTGIIDFLNNCLSNSILLIGYVVILFLISPKLLMISLLFIPLYLCWIIWISHQIKVKYEQLQISKDDLIIEISRIRSNLLSIHIFNLFKTVNNQRKKVVINNVNSLKSAFFYNNLSLIISGTLMTASSMFPLIMGIIDVKNGILSTGDLIAFNSYNMLMLTPVTGLMQTLTSYKALEIYFKRIDSLIKHDKINNIMNPKLITNFEKNWNEQLIFDNISINSNSKIILENVSLTVKRGDIIFLEGDNGSGKSLLFMSLINAYPYTGNIYYENMNLKELTVTEISESIMYISSKQNFYFNNIQDNIMGDSNVEDVKYNMIIRMLNVDKFDMSKQYERFDESFSLGQLQLFRICRGLMKFPKIIIFDEIFSNIDKTKTNEIINNIKLNMPKLTIIVIEHHGQKPSNSNITNWRITDKTIKVK